MGNTIRKSRNKRKKRPNPYGSCRCFQCWFGLRKRKGSRSYAKHTARRINKSLRKKGEPGKWYGLYTD